MKAQSRSLFDWNIVGPAIGDSFKKLNPRLMVKNPVMFVTMVGAALTTVGIFTAKPDLRGFVTQLAVWLGSRCCSPISPKQWPKAAAKPRRPACGGRATKRWRVACRRPRRKVPAPDLEKGDIVVCEAGDIIPADGDVIEGIASVDNRHHRRIGAGHPRERRRPQRGHRRNPRVQRSHRHSRDHGEGRGFLDRMIALVEGARRQKTPNEIALTILLAALTFIFLLVCVTLKPFGIYSGTIFSVPVLIALLVCLIPTTIGGLLSAIGISRNGSRASAQCAGNQRARRRSRR